LVGSAMSMAAGDLMLNAAVSAVQGGGGVVAAGAGGLYERVIAFGAKYRGAGAVASEELTAWVAAQKVVAGTPEIRAWLAAQRKLQVMRNAATMATSTAAAATSRRAAGGVVEEGLMAAATATAAKGALSSTATNIGTSATAPSLEATGSAKDELDSSEETLLLSSSNNKNLTITTTSAAVAEECSRLASSATNDANATTGDSLPSSLDGDNS